MKTVLALLLWLASVPFAAAQYYPDPEAKTWLASFLAELGLKTGTFFTTDRWMPPPQPIQIEGQNIYPREPQKIDDRDVAHIDTRLIQANWDPKIAIEKYYPLYRVFPSTIDKRIYHVVDRRIERDFHSYAMNHPIASFEFQGSPQEYQRKVAEKAWKAEKGGDWVSIKEMSFRLRQAPFPDVSIRFEKKTLREALELCIDLDRCGPLLWSSSTCRTEKGEPLTTFEMTSQVRFKNSP